MVIILYFLHLLHYGLYNLQYKTLFKYIAYCTTHNTKIFLNVLWFVQPAMYLKKNCIAGCTTCNVFKKKFMLWVDKPAAVI